MYGKRELSIQNIRGLVTGLDVFRYYCTPFKELNRPFCSELREDKNPTCSIACFSGKFIYKDFANGDTFDEVSYLQHKYSLSYIETLAIINRDFNLDLATNVQPNAQPTMLYFGVSDKSIDVEKLEKESTYIKVKIRAWNPVSDKAYWKERYGFTSSQLDYFRVVPISYFWINERMYSCKGNSYAYYLGKEGDRDIWKIYQPLEVRTRKWFTNASKYQIQGDEQLPETAEQLYITSSLKDIITLRKLGKFAVAPSSESTPLDKEKIEEYKRRFKKLTIFYDNDKAGIASASKHCELYNCNSMVVPVESEITDPSDYVEKYGYDKLREIIDENEKCK
jgi:hypothetical protein